MGIFIQRFVCHYALFHIYRTVCRIICSLKCSREFSRVKDICTRGEIYPFLSTYCYSLVNDCIYSRCRFSAGIITKVDVISIYIFIYNYFIAAIVYISSICDNRIPITVVCRTYVISIRENTRLVKCYPYFSVLIRIYLKACILHTCKVCILYLNISRKLYG